VKFQASTLDSLTVLLISSERPTRHGLARIENKVRHLRIFMILKQGPNEVRWRPRQETNLAPPCSNLRPFRSKSALEEGTCDIVRTFRPSPEVIWPPGNCVPPWPPVVTSLYSRQFIHATNTSETKPLAT